MTALAKNKSHSEKRRVNIFKVPESLISDVAFFEIQLTCFLRNKARKMTCLLGYESQKTTTFTVAVVRTSSLTKKRGSVLQRHEHISQMPCLRICILRWV